MQTNQMKISTFQIIFIASGHVMFLAIFFSNFPPGSLVSSSSVLFSCLMTLTTNTNPGVGLKLTAPRISKLVTSTLATPCPQSYHIKNFGIIDLTERQKIQNALLSKRYEKNKRPSTSGIVLTHQTRFETTKPLLCSFPVRPSSKKSSRNRPKITPPKAIECPPFYSIRGLADLSDREVKRNEMISKRYAVKA